MQTEHETRTNDRRTKNQKNSMKMTVEYSTHPSVACNTLNNNDGVDSKTTKVLNKAILAKLPPCCQVTTIAGTNGSSCKKMAKSERMGGSSFRHMLPIALCLFSFAVVFTVLLLYMDTDRKLTRLYHHLQFISIKLIVCSLFVSRLALFVASCRSN